MADANTTVTETNKAENNGGDHMSPSGDKQPVSPESNPKGEKGVSTNEGAEKAFTQSEFDAIVKQRLERQAKGQPTKEEMDAFHKWQDSQKTAEQLSQEKITAAENGRTEAVKRAEEAEAKCMAYSKGVKADAVDDVIALAMVKVSDSKTIEQAIDEVVTKYPSFCGAAETKSSITTGVSFSGSPNDRDGVTAAFLKRNPNIKI